MSTCWVQWRHEWPGCGADNISGSGTRSVSGSSNISGPITRPEMWYNSWRPPTHTSGPICGKEKWSNLWSTPPTWVVHMKVRATLNQRSTKLPLAPNFLSVQWSSLATHKIFTERKYITTLHTRRDLKKNAAAPYRTSLEWFLCFTGFRCGGSAGELRK